MDSVEVGDPGFGIWEEDRKALGALAMSFFFFVQIWDSERQVFSIAIGLNNEGSFLTTWDLVWKNVLT